MSKSSLANITVPASTSNYTKGRSGRKIEMITIHHMAGVLSAKRCGELFQVSNRGASSNYGIGNDGEIALYVDENDTSWCNSNWDSNCKSVTIETSNNKIGGQWTVSDEALNSLIKLAADIAKRNNLGTLVKGKNVTWHRMYSATTCPGDYLLSKMDYIVEEANKINEAPVAGEFKVGDKVIINGGLYVSPNAEKPAGYVSNRETVITRVFKDGKHQYNTTGDLGWMDYDSIKLVSSQDIKYIVKPGDTLSDIALKYGTTWQKIYEDNKAIIGSDPNLIRPGQALNIWK